MLTYLIVYFAIAAFVTSGAISSPLDGNRIVGGQNTTITGHAHQVSLRFKDPFNPEDPYMHYCGGSVYSDRVIITAAHCVIGEVPSSFHVVAGSKFRNDSDGFMVPVQEIIMHEDYNPTNQDNDVAIMVLGAPLPINGVTTRTIPLIDYEVRAGLLATVTGWGALEEGAGDYPVHIQEVKVPIISFEDCYKDYADIITVSMLCAGYRGVGGKDACQGDSGGPLVVDGKLAGIVSWGFGCADPQFPGVYSKISYLREWILDVIDNIKYN